MDFSNVTQLIQSYTGKVAPAITVQVRWHGQVVYEQAQGYLDPDTCLRPVQMDSLFDLASVTKLFVVTAFMSVIERGRQKVDGFVRCQLPGFDGPRPIEGYEHPLQPGTVVEPLPAPSGWVDAGQITYRNLLAHNSGLPAWRPLKDQPDRAAALRMALNTPFFYPTGTRVIYSDIGLILLGQALEPVSRNRLDEAVRELVTKPLNLAHTRFLPVSGQPRGVAPWGEPYDTRNIAPTEFCAWRNRRIVGEVHDENAARLGGIAGHAGLFSTASDLARFGQSFIDRRPPLLNPRTIAEMTRLQAQDGNVRRGLGFALWSPDPEASGNPFDPSAFGHTGFTGTSLWIDPKRALVVAVLTNRVYYGRDADLITRFRPELHRAIVQEIDRCA
jgi:CubicO group peptidase (beta-lactamase class C family)